MNEDGDSGGFQNTSYIQLCIIVLSTFQFVVFFSLCGIFTNFSPVLDMLPYQVPSVATSVFTVASFF